MLIPIHSAPTPTDPLRGATYLFDLQINGAFGATHSQPKISVIYHKPTVTSQPFPPVTAGSVVKYNNRYVVSLRGLLRLMSTHAIGAQILFPRDISLADEPYSKVLQLIKDMPVDGLALNEVLTATSQTDLKNIERDFDPRFWPAHYGELVYFLEAAIRESGIEFNRPMLGWRNVNYDYCIYHRMELFTHITVMREALSAHGRFDAVSEDFYNEIYTKAVDILHTPIG